MRIAIVTESFTPQAAADSLPVERICEHLHARGHDVLVVTSGTGPSTFAGARVARTIDSSAALREFDAEVVHVVDAGPLGARAAHAARELGLPLVTVPAATELDLDLFHPARRDAALRARLAPNGEVLVGYQPTETGLAAHLSVLDARPDVRLVVLGAAAQRGGIARTLPNAAFLADLDAAGFAGALASLDVFVQPGTDPASVQSTRRAMAAGVPVVAAETFAQFDAVVPGRTGYLVEPGRPGALAARVATVAADEDLRLQLAVAARESISRRSWQTLGDELLGHYRAALRTRVTV